MLPLVVLVLLAGRVQGYKVTYKFLFHINKPCVKVTQGIIHII